MRWKPYPRYKPSGVEWLGDVPEGWEVSRIKHNARIRYGLGEPPAEHPEGVPFVRATDVNRGRIDLSRVRLVDPDDVPWDRRPKLDEGEILVVRSGAYTGDSAIVVGDAVGAVAGYDMVLTPLKADPRFMAFALLSRYVLEGQIDLARMRAAQPHLNAEELGDVVLVSPPLPEQHTIADFLDRETARLDTLIDKKRQLIERLREKRTALISHTVTRGLPPDEAARHGLPVNPPLKDSGVEWIGEIPAHWGVRSLKRIASAVTVGVVVNPSTYVADEGVPFLLGGNVREFKINVGGSKRCLPDISDGPLSKSRLNGGDLVCVRVGYPGATAVVPPDLDGANCASMMIIRKHDRFHSQWLAYCMNSQIGRDQIELVQYGAAQKQFNISHALEFTFPFPEKSEHLKIANYLDRETTKIDCLVDTIQEAIDRLQEYRAALITAAVTGKIDVRNPETTMMKSDSWVDDNGTVCHG